MKSRVSPSVLGPVVSGNKGHFSGCFGGWGGIPAAALHVIRHCLMSCVRVSKQASERVQVRSYAAAIEA